jgi:trk system potassium uptake protein TrkA
MAAKLQICVIGLGKFGYKVGISLLHLNHQVIGIDSNPANVQRAQKMFHQVYEADISNKQALEQIGFREITHALISVGDSISTSAMTTMYLKAINDDHATLLRKIGADEVIIPEHIAAEQLADRIHIPGIIDRLPFDPDMIIREMTISQLTGKNLRDIDLSNRFNCQIIAIRKQAESHYRYIPKADDILTAGDSIIVIGKSVTMSKIVP